MDLNGSSEREFWAEVSRRPGLFVSRPSFTSLTAYLNGYDAHAYRHGGSELDGWYDWLVARRGRECNHAWNGVVRHIALPEGWEVWELTPDQDRRVMEVFFELLDEFLAEQEQSRPDRRP
ncbi:hypothetical protein OG474_19835 [Kribbella sp. NBC_01505]|uniref:hypothetical protein n=1 Tax=Kribbella sp. NBC_01505 TaxID=2903580 RepID=UPI0038683D1E